MTFVTLAHETEWRPGPGNSSGRKLPGIGQIGPPAPKNILCTSFSESPPSRSLMPNQ